MLAQVIIETLAATQPILGAVYYWRQKKSTRASLLELRRQGMTIDQLASVFKINRSTVIKCLAEQQLTSVEEFIEDQSEDWRARYRKWCCEQKVHYELGACAYCEECKKKAEQAAVQYCDTRCRCDECERDRYEAGSYSSSSSWGIGFGDSSSSSDWGGGYDDFGPLR